MRLSQSAAVLLVLCLRMTAGAAAQMMHRGPHPLQRPTPLDPVVGSGAHYQVTTQEGSVNFRYTVVGKEPRNGKEGYWFEIRTQSPGMKGEMIMKELTVPKRSRSEIIRLILQPPGRPVIEMPAGMVSIFQQRPQSGRETGNGGLGEKIETESITGPAGTFECNHYRTQGNGKQVDL